jgi:hypothetical protein
MCEVKYDAREFYEKVIKPDAKEIADKIRDGEKMPQQIFLGNHQDNLLNLGLPFRISYICMLICSHLWVYKI